MISRTSLRLLFVALFTWLVIAVNPVCADSSHVRIIRLSLVQGEVRFARDVHGDPLANTKAIWEKAELNLPIHQGYVIATDNGRAEVEFENGAMAFLSENTILQFYDLSIDDGAIITRLVLRQGTASFYVNPARGSYFSVTGGDFTVEANDRTAFRVDNFDDGSTVDVSKGRIAVLRKDSNTPLEKGQSLTVKAGDSSTPVISRLQDDDFDRWVSGRIDSVTTATNAALQYGNSPNYTSGIADLYAYGSWFQCGGLGMAWRPFGVGANWAPFTTGNWYYDPAFGWAWISADPWGWMPSHFGGWGFSSGCGGWYYIPPTFYGVTPVVPGKRRLVVPVRPPHPIWRGATVAWVRNQGKVGFVPLHPDDQSHKPPVNLAHGIFGMQGKPISAPEESPSTEGWKIVKSPSRETLSTNLAVSTAPVRVSRSVTPVTASGQESSIVYDPREHRFVNSNNTTPTSEIKREALSEKNQPVVPPSTSVPIVAARTAQPPPSAPRGSAIPTVPRMITPPPAPRVSGGGERVSNPGGTGWRGGVQGSSGSSSGASSHGTSAPASSGAHSGGGGHSH